MHILAVPVNFTTSPIDSTLGVGGKTTGPERQFETSRSLREHILFGSSVVCLVFIQDADGFSVEIPGDRIGSPINLVGVEVFERVGVNGSVDLVVI